MRMFRTTRMQMKIATKEEMGKMLLRKQTKLSGKAGTEVVLLAMVPRNLVKLISKKIFPAKQPTRLIANKLLRANQTISRRKSNISKRSYLTVRRKSNRSRRNETRLQSAGIMPNLTSKRSKRRLPSSSPPGSVMEMASKLKCLQF